MQTCDSQHNHRTPGIQSSAVNTYASYLKSVYTQGKLQVYDKWPLVESKKYINLVLIQKKNITKPEAVQFMRATIHGNIDDIKKSKRVADISQIAQLPDGSQPKCILVEGAPGVGKSTFAWKLCRKWGKGKLLQQYHLVVLLRLRDKIVRDAKNISDLFRYRDHQIQQAAVEEIKQTWGKGVFLLFEGYNELPEKLRTESSVFLNVITGGELPEATVLITSRPWASEFLRRECKRHISQHIEILGFTKANIQSYLESTIPDDLSLLADLKKYISCYPHVNSMMYIPLNSAIVVEVYRNSRKEETLVPKTMTELYSSLFRSLLLRHLLDHPVHGKKRRWRVRNFSDLPQDVYQQLCELGRIAYEGILDGQQVIFSDLPEDFETLGLMQCAPELYADEGAAVSYNFLHLTVQEYLAAFHLSQEPVEKQIEHFKEYMKVTGSWSSQTRQPPPPSETLHDKQEQWDTQFHMVLQFLCGLRKFDRYPSEVLNTLCVKRSGGDSATVVPFDTLHWLFEAQDSDVIANVLGSSDIQPPNRFETVTPFDCFVLGYCVSHSNCTWKVRCTINNEGVEMLVRGAVEEETCCTGKISEINLSITSQGVKHLLHLPNQRINKLETLVVSNNELDSEFCAILPDLIPHVPHLKGLNLSNNPNIGQGGTVPLMTSLTADNLLEWLDVSSTRIGVEDCQALSELLSSTSLKELDISRNDLPPEAVELIISGLHHNTTLKWLNMDHLQFSFENTISLASVLRTNHTLVYLSLAKCDIDSDGACQLASALSTNDTLRKLDLGHNPIGVKGATAFAEMLRTNHTIVKLLLDICKIDSDGPCQLASALCTNHTLQELYLQHNPIGVTGATVFAEMLLKNKSLKKLDLQDDSIGEEGAWKLTDSLTHNTKIEKLVIPIMYRFSIVSSKRVTFGLPPLPPPSQQQLSLPPSQQYQLQHNGD